MHVVLWCALTALAAAGPLPPGCEVGPVGELQVGEVTLAVQHFAPGWHCATQSDRTLTAQCEANDTSLTWVGSYQTLVPGRAFAFREELRRVDPQTLGYDVRLTAAPALGTEQLALGINLPVTSYVGLQLEFGDESFELPLEPFEGAVVRRKLDRLVVPTRQGWLTFRGELGLQIQDGRQFADRRHFRLRLYFQPETGPLTDSRLSFTMQLKPYAKGEAVPAFGEAMKSTIEAGDDWFPLPDAVFTQPGSALDWSTWPLEPGGPMVARNGRLEFADAPDRPVRLYGTNLCAQANYPTHAEADKLAAQLRRMGYNAVRLHHYDRHLPKPGRPLSEGFDAEKLERFDYLFSALKQQGLAISIDLYTVRKVLKGELKEIDRDVWLNEFKALVAISPSAMANWQEFSRLLLTHVNPYTKLAWKDDPALVSICLLNEDDLTVHQNAAPDIAKLYQQRFDAWREARGKSPARPSEAPQDHARFLLELHQQMADRCTAYLRQLGVTSLLTDANYRQDIALNLLRQSFELVDNHDYWDLKHFLAEQWKLPYGHHQRSAVASGARWPASLFAARLYGKPYTITEFNACYPNHYRAEGGPLMGAYAALQGWDGVFRYAYAHTVDRATEPRPAFYLDTATDPLNLLSDRIGILLFRRGDVAQAKGSYAYAYGPDWLDQTDPLARAITFVPEELRQLGLVSRLGSFNQATGARPPADCRAVIDRSGGAGRDAATDGLLDRLAADGRLPAGLIDRAAGKFVSDTGELRLDSKAGRFTVVTPRTECLVLADGGAATADRLAVSGVKGAVTVAVSALDDQPLASSRHLLVFHLTDLQNTKVQFGDPDHTILEAWGELPHLVRAGRADVTVRFDASQPVTVYGLDLSGARGAAVPARLDGGVLSFTALLAAGQPPYLVYEVVR